MSIFCFMVLASAELAQAESDFYPEARALILEAAAASKAGVTLPDKSRPLLMAANLLTRAGYLDDAIRVAARDGAAPDQLYLAQTLYGDLPAALKTVAAMRDPGIRTTRITAIAQLLWRMGDRTNADIVLDEAERTAKSILNTEQRKTQLQIIAQERAAFPGHPPVSISATPQPRGAVVFSSSVPAFPITVDGFRDEDPARVTSLASANEAYLTQLYALVVAGDRESLKKHTEQASTPFQRAMGMASIEHLWFQLGALEEAEQSAIAIPDDKADCSLGKAEALTAAATAWARQANSERAAQSFNAALQAVDSVSAALAYGKVVVTAAIAVGQFESGMTDASQKTFETALTLAGQVPLRPRPVNGTYPKNYFGTHFRDSAYSGIFQKAMRIQNLEMARKTIEPWRNSGSDQVNNDIVSAWFNVGRKDEAVSYARSLKNEASHIRALLMAARLMLDEAGAPNF
jgi:hypothetical protein